MTRRDAAPHLLVATVAWTTAAGGGTSGTDLAVVTVVLLTALLAVADRPVRVQASTALVAVAILELWLLATGTRGGAFDLASLRVPALVLVAVLTVSATRRLDGRQRALVVGCLILVGIFQGCVAIGQVLLTLSTTGPMPGPTRAMALVGNANALGVLLAATCTLTLRALVERPSGLLGGALAVQASALLLTGSRLAITVAVVVLLWCRPRRQPRWASTATAAWALAALAIVVARFAVSGWDRVGLWRAALEQIAQQPVAGRGTGPVVLDVPASSIGPTTHAHNELLQLAMEYGLVAPALVAVILGVALRSVTWRTCDRWLVAAAAALVAGGFTDISLRVTAVTVTAALLATMAVVPPTGAVSGREREKDATADL